MSLLSMITFTFLVIDYASAKLIQAAVGDDVQFALTEECKHGTGSLHHHLMNGNDQLVAALDGVWKPGSGYRNRVNQSGDSLILRSVDFNDHGYFALACNNKQKDELDELHVFLPSNITGLRGQDVTLTCRCITAGQRVKLVRWRRHGEAVLELDVQSGKIRYGNGFDESRVSIPSDWDRRADASLTIKRAEVKDGGVYYCDLDKTEKHRSAVRLQVRLPAPTLPPGTPSQAAATPRPPECPYWSWTTFSTTAAVSAIVGLVWYLRNRSFRGCARPNDEEASKDEEHLHWRTTSNSCGLCSGKEDGDDEEDRESDCPRKHAEVKPLTTNGSKKVHPSKNV